MSGSISISKLKKYSIDREGDAYEMSGHDCDWRSSLVWSNFQNCTISSTRWGEGGFLVGRLSKFSLERLNGLELNVDPLPLENDDYEGTAFGVYLLGHDTVADHRIKFLRDPKSSLFDILWRGKIALTYSGEYDFRHSFEALIKGVEAPAFFKKGRFRLLR